MRRACRGSHLSDWAMLACTSPTRSVDAVDTNVPCAMRYAPQLPVSASPRTPLATHCHRVRPLDSSAATITRLTATTQADRPYTPTTLASCAMGSTSTWL